AIVIEVLFVLFNIGGIVLQLTQSNGAGAGGSGMRVAIEIAILAGFFQRKSASRTAAIVLSSIGLVLMFVCGGLALFAAQIPQVRDNLPGEAMAFVIAVLVGQVLMYVTQIGVLLTGSAQDYFDE